MAGRKKPKLPSPRQAMPSRQPDARGTYISITRAADRYLAKAEEAIRMAALLWADVDSGLETTCEELANQVLAERQEAVTTVDELYGDRLAEGVF